MGPISKAENSLKPESIGPPPNCIIPPCSLTWAWTHTTMFTSGFSTVPPLFPEQQLCLPHRKGSLLLHQEDPQAVRRSDAAHQLYSVALTSSGSRSDCRSNITAESLHVSSDTSHLDLLSAKCKQSKQRERSKDRNTMDSWQLKATIYYSSRGGGLKNTVVCGLQFEITPFF